MTRDNVDMHITTISDNPINEFHRKNSVTEAIMKLGVSDRAVIVLYYYQELPVKEIAGIIGKSQNTTLQRLNRARMKLKKILMGEGYDENGFEATN